MALAIPTFRPSVARMLKHARGLVYGLIPPGASATTVAGNDPNVAKLASAFSRYASTSQTAFDTGAAQSSSAGGVNVLERQAERALSQVLGRAPGRASDSFISALNDAFPVGSNGQVTTLPSRSAVSMYAAGPVGTTNGAMVAPAVVQQSIAAGLVGQLSVEQAALYRQATTISTDAYNVLAGLQPFAPVADINVVNMLRDVVGSEIRSLVEEFGRIDLPRTDRVESYFTMLLGPNQTTGHLADLGRRALIDGSWSPAAETEEGQIAAYTLLRHYALSLYSAWERYMARPSPRGSLSFSLQIQEASRMLTVVAESNNNFMASMDSIGFDENERRSVGLTFDTLQLPTPLPAGLPAQYLPNLPNITVFDATGWFDSLSNVDGQSTLADAGLFGLDYVTDQADQLFRLLAVVLIAVRFSAAGPGSGSLLQQVLTHERVAWAIDDLFFQTKTLADLAA